MASQLLKDKSREISYALVRVSFYIKRDDLRQRMESLAFRLLHDVAVVEIDSEVSNVNKALSAISALDGLVRLAHSIYEIEPVNATILVRELDNLNSAIRQSGKLGSFIAELPNLESFFTKEIIGKKVVENNLSNNQATPAMKDISPKETIRNDNPIKSGSMNNLSSAIRQSAIINKLKSFSIGQEKSGNGCRLKDLIAELPDVSERTLRYDLQRLCDQGVVERVGNGGPSSYYRLSNSIISPDRVLADRIGISR